MKGCNSNEFHSLKYCPTSWYLGNSPPLVGANYGIRVKLGSLDSHGWSCCFFPDLLQTYGPFSQPRASVGCKLNLRVDALGPTELGLKLVKNHWTFGIRMTFYVDGKIFLEFGLFLQGLTGRSRLGRLPQREDEASDEASAHSTGRWTESHTGLKAGGWGRRSGN